MAKPTKFTFFRPHRRIQEHGELVNPHTGDISVPPSMTKQEFVRECDINNIVKQYSTRGILTHISGKAAMGAYQDLPDSYDFQESLHVVKQAEEAFLSLPSKTRERFGNEPSEFLAFLADPKNKDEAISLGLINPAAEPPVVPALPPDPNRGGDGGNAPPVDGSKSPKN